MMDISKYISLEEIIRRLDNNRVNPHISPAFYCSDVYSSVYFVTLAHPSSTYCRSTPAESALASLVSTTVYAASKQKLVKYVG